MSRHITQIFPIEKCQHTKADVTTSLFLTSQKQIIVLHWPMVVKKNMLIFLINRKLLEKNQIRIVLEIHIIFCTCHLI